MRTRLAAAGAVAVPARVPDVLEPHQRQARVQIPSPSSRPSSSSPSRTALRQRRSLVTGRGLMSLGCLCPCRTLPWATPLIRQQTYHHLASGPCGETSDRCMASASQSPDVPCHDAIAMLFGVHRVRADGRAGSLLWSTRRATGVMRRTQSGAWTARTLAGATTVCFSREVRAAQLLALRVLMGPLTPHVTLATVCSLLAPCTLLARLDGG